MSSVLRASSRTAMLCVVSLVAAMFTPAGVIPLSGVTAAGAATNTTVTIEFDDGYASQYQTGAMLNAHGMDATYYINSATRPPAYGNMSWAQIHDLANGGHEIGGHTLDHPNLTTLSTAAATAQVCNDRNALIAQGFTVTSFAYPFGKHNASVRSIVQNCGYTSGRDVVGIISPEGCGGPCPFAESIPPLNAYATRTPQNVNQDTPLSEIQGFVTQAENNGGGWVQLVFHDICSPGSGCDYYSMPPATFNALLDWLAPRAANGTVVKTVAEVIGGDPLPPPSGPYAPVIVGDTPAGYWRLGETSGTTAANAAVPASPGTYQSATLGAASLLSSDADKAASFNGTAGRVQVASSAALSPAATVSVEAWMKPTTLPAAGAFRSVASKAESYSLQFNGPRLEFTIIQGATRRRLQAPVGAIAAGGTYHVVGTYDGTTQRLYLNGALSASVALTGAINVNANPFVVGSWNGSQEFFSGSIDEVAVYGTALTANQVANHRSAGTNVAPPSQFLLSVSKSGAGTGTVTSSPAGINCGATCSASFDSGSTVTLTAVPAAGSTFSGWSGGGCTGTGQCVVTLNAATTVTATFVVAPTSSYQQVVSGDAPAGYWRLNETTGTTAANTAVPASPGTYRGVTLNQPGLLASASNRAVLFNSTTSRVQIASTPALSPTARVTVEAWIKPTALPAAGAFASIASKAESYSLQFNGPRLEFTIMQAAVRRRLQAPVGAVAVGGTYHVVGTYDGTTQRLYINGASVASVALTGAITANTTALYVGTWNGSNELFKGTIDEVAVYSTALTAAQVANHRSAGLAP